MLPTGDVVIKDAFSTGAANYKEFWYALVGLAGEGQNFDGNGMYVRFQTGGGTQTVSLGTTARRRRAVRQRRRRAAGQPARLPGKRPPYKPDVPCYKQTLPDVNGPAGRDLGRRPQRGPGDRQRREPLPMRASRPRPRPQAGGQ